MHVLRQTVFIDAPKVVIVIVIIRVIRITIIIVIIIIIIIVFFKKQKTKIWLSSLAGKRPLNRSVACFLKR